MLQQVQVMQISKLKPYENQPFKRLSSEKFAELVSSIKDMGVITPITVRPIAEELYQILSGHNRCNASLDDSREANAEKTKLEKELAELQEELADYQAGYQYDAQVDTLDKMADAYEKEKDEEAKILENSISSQQKLYDLAIDRINNQWNMLYQDLVNWNYNYGNNLTTEITSAWNLASQAVQQYGSYLSAVMQTQSQLNALNSSCSSSSYSNGSSTSLGSSNSNYDTSGSQTLSQITSLVNQMKSNSSQWNAADAANRPDVYNALNQQQNQLAAQVASLLGQSVVRGNDGVWYIGKVGGDQLYKKFHTGTWNVGDNSSLKNNEVMAVLEDDEAVLTKKQKENAYQIVDWGKYMMDKFGGTLGNVPMPAPSGSIVNIARDMQSQTERNISNIANSSSVIVENINVEAPINVVEKLTKDAFLEHSQTIKDLSIGVLKEGFTRRGI